MSLFEEALGYKISPKTIETKDHTGAVNGKIIEIGRIHNSNLVRAYISTLLPGKFKGFHKHNKINQSFVLLEGDVSISLSHEYTKLTENYVLKKYERLDVPPTVIIGITNNGSTEAKLLCLPNPYLDIDDKKEQETINKTAHKEIAI